LGGYVCYRTLLDSPAPYASGLRGRLLNGVLHGVGVLAFGSGLAAAGIFPRLECNKLSNLAEGYSGTGGQADISGGWSASDYGLLLEAGSSWYAGVSVLAFAVVAPFIVRRGFAVPYFAVLAVSALVLSLSVTTPLHSAFYLLLLALLWREAERLAVPGSGGIKTRRRRIRIEVEEGCLTRSSCRRIALSRSSCRYSTIGNPSARCWRYWTSPCGGRVSRPTCSW
jgi:hypothetical protein